MLINFVHEFMIHDFIYTMTYCESFFIFGICSSYHTATYLQIKSPSYTYIQFSSLFLLINGSPESIHTIFQKMGPKYNQILMHDVSWNTTSNQLSPVKVFHRTTQLFYNLRRNISRENVN